MTAMIKTLRRDLADHQEVEKELAKRSHFCQKVIQKYKTQIKQLKTSIDEQKKKDTGVTPQQRDESDLLEYLNERIGNYEMRLKQTQTHLKQQEQEYEGLLEKVWEIRAKYAKTDLLLTEFIEHFVQEDPEILNRQSDIYLDID